MPSVSCPNARLPQTTGTDGLIVFPELQGPPAPLGCSPAPQPRSPAFLGPQWGVRLPLRPCASALSTRMRCSLSAPPDAACLHPRPLGLGVPTLRPLPRACSFGPRPQDCLAPKPAPPGGQATPRLLGLPGSSDHPAPAPPRELFRRPQGSLGMLRRRRLE